MRHDHIRTAGVNDTTLCAALRDEKTLAKDPSRASPRQMRHYCAALCLDRPWLRRVLDVHVIRVHPVTVNLQRCD